jgi:hypothetical protein
MSDRILASYLHDVLERCTFPWLLVCIFIAALHSNWQPNKVDCGERLFPPRTANTHVLSNRPHRSYDGYAHLGTLNLMHCGDKQTTLQSRATYTSAAPAQKRIARTMIDTHIVRAVAQVAFIACGLQVMGRMRLPCDCGCQLGFGNFEAGSTAVGQRSQISLKTSSTSKGRFGECIGARLEMLW